MADSVEQRLMTAIVDRLTGIDGTGNFNTEIGARVEDSRPNWDENELPAISIFEGTVTSQPFDDEGEIVTRTMPVMIKASFLRSDTAGAAAAFARKANADIMLALREDDTWTVAGDQLALYTQEKSHGIEYAENTFEITGVQVEIEITYLAYKFDLDTLLEQNT